MKKILNRQGHQIWLHPELPGTYRVMLTPRNGPESKLMWKMRGPKDYYQSVHPPGGPYIGISGKLDCFGIQDEVVQSIIRKDKNIYLKTMNTKQEQTSFTSEDQVLDQLLQSPDKIQNKLHALRIEISTAETNLEALRQRLSMWETLAGISIPKKIKMVKKVAVKKTAVKKAAKREFDGATKMAIDWLTTHNKAATVHELAEVLKKNWNIKHGNKLKKLQHTLNCGLLSNTTSGSPKVWRDKTSSGAFRYGIINNNATEQRAEGTVA